MKKQKNKTQQPVRQSSQSKMVLPQNTDKDFKRIYDLVQLITQNGIAEISFEKKDYKLTIKQMSANMQISQNHLPEISIPSPIITATSPPPPPAQNTPVAPPPPSENNTNLITVKSPIIGTFYRKPAPNSPNFVDIGTEITKGKVLCIIEAMKLFNEIESEVEGKIAKILVEDAAPVEFDQPLFLVEPK